MSDGIKRINEHVIKDGRTLILTKFISDTANIAEGTIYINPTTGELKYVHLSDDGTKRWDRFDSNAIFDKDTFDTDLIKDNSLHGAKLIEGSVSMDKLADNCVVTNKIADKSITDAKFDINSIDGDKIKDFSIITSKIHIRSITNPLIADNAITTEKIMEKAINKEKMADESIGTIQIIDKSITTSKIADKSITSNLLADKIITSSKIGLKEVKTDNIDNLSITLEKIADGSVQGKKIPNFAIKDFHIDSMDGYKIFENTITSDKIKNSAIKTNLIADNSVTMAKLDGETQSFINNSIKTQAIVTIDGVEYYNTAYIKGNVVLKNTDGSKVNLEVNGDIKATGDITGARVFNPYFSDIAEAYSPMCPLLPGDAVALCEEGILKVTKLTRENAGLFLGFVSDDYGTLLGGDKAEVNTGLKIPVCLIGRIKVKLPLELEGEVGDYLNIDNSYKDFYISKRKGDFSVGRLLESKAKDQIKVLCQLWP